ncbi:MAG: tetratricopeptide repeat protein [Acidobacteriota bacterium]
MKNLSLFALILSLSLVGLSQTPSRSKNVRPSKARSASTLKKTSAALAEPTPQPADPAAEKAMLEDALATATPAEKADKIQKFLKLYPASADTVRAQESLTVARAALADAKLQAGETEAGVALFRTALSEAPKPYSDRFFAEVISRIPANLYWRGHRAEAVEAAVSIEKNIGTNINQILVLANFYVSIENGDEAKRLADAALKLNAESAGAYLVTGHANRLNFALEDAATAYSKALELDPSSLIAMKGKAEMLRALGKPDEAAEIYREILAKSETDNQSRAGLVLSLFDAGKRAEAEAEMAKALEANSGNVVLLAGAAYWYAAQNNGAKAVELGKQAVAAEPRYIWSHIALARGLIAQKRPLDAEQVLTAARKFGNFPTLEYEIAAARVMSGFYGEAAAELEKSFSVTDGAVETKLGGRIPRREKSFSDLIAYERRASIFEPAGAETADTAERLKALLEFSQGLAAASPDETALAVAADDFIKGDDKMKLHRQLFIANELLQKRVALGKVLELTGSAIGNTDAALETPDAPAAVMANELYESRAIAFARGDYLLVPNVPKPTLSAILRGRVEEITGRALFNQGNYADAVVRLRRAVSVYPDKSAWQRSGMWHLGAALEADGKDKEAVDYYIRSYKTDKPDVAKYVVVENLFRKVNGSVDGLEAQIGPNPLPTAALPAAAETAVPTVAAEVNTVKIEKPAPTETPAIAEPSAEEIKSVPVPTEPAAEETKIEPAKAEPANTELKTEPAAAEIKPDIAKEVVATDPQPSPAVVETKLETKQVEVPAASEPMPDPIEIRTAEPAAEKPIVESLPADVKTDLPKEIVVAAPAVADTPAEPVPTETKQADTPTELPTQPLEPEPKPAEASANPDAPPAGSVPAVQTEAIPEVTPDENTPKEKPQPVTEKLTPKLIVTDTLVRAPAVTAAGEPPVKHYEVVRTDLPPPTGRIGPAKLTAAVPKSKIVKPDGPLFEPVIIKIPANSESKTAEAQNNADSRFDARPRVITGAEVRGELPPSCTLSISDESVSVINDGGSVGVLVELSGAEKDTLVTAASSSPENVDVKIEPENDAARQRRFYIIRSISPTVGLFNVAFTAPCGKATVKVRVR